MKILIAGWTIGLGAALLASAVSQVESQVDLWRLANDQKSVHRYSTLFTAHDVRDRLSTDAGIDAAIEWCRKTGVTKAYVEEFRDGYQAKAERIKHARDRFRAAGIETSGCITTTKVGKASTGWKDVISCYTDPATQEHLESIFRFAAELFDEIMIDDFWFTDCTCRDCEAARTSRSVTIGSRKYPVMGDTWEDYRRELMIRLSQDRVLGPAKQVNPRVKLIIKYPQWYDSFHERGYEVVRESADFDRIWVGTETRDYADPRWGGTPQYEAYFIMRWLGGIGGPKCGGGWFDPYGTTKHTYVEQARQTVLGAARESLLFCYGSLQEGTGPSNVEALRATMLELLKVASEVRRRSIVGIAAYKPPNSHAENERRVFDFVGMLGLPLVPCHEFPTNAPAGFFSAHSLKDPDLDRKLGAFIDAGKPTLITDGLAVRISGRVILNRPNARILQAHGDPKSLLNLSEGELNALRAPILKPFKASFQAPNRVALYLFRDGSWVVENFNDAPAAVKLNGRDINLQPRGWTFKWAKSTGAR